MIRLSAMSLSSSDSVRDLDIVSEVASSLTSSLLVFLSSSTLSTPTTLASSSVLYPWLLTWRVAPLGTFQGKPTLPCVTLGKHQNSPSS